MDKLGLRGKFSLSCAKNEVEARTRHVPLLVCLRLEKSHSNFELEKDIYVPDLLEALILVESIEQEPKKNRGHQEVETAKSNQTTNLSLEWAETSIFLEIYPKLLFLKVHKPQRNHIHRGVRVLESSWRILEGEHQYQVSLQHQNRPSLNIDDQSCVFSFTDSAQSERQLGLNHHDVEPAIIVFNRAISSEI